MVIQGNSYMKVVFLTVMPSPYMQDLFTALHVDKRFDLKVLYLENEAPDTYWGPQEMPDYAHVLPGSWINLGGARVHINPSVTRWLQQEPADLVVIAGYIGLSNQIAMRHLARHHRPWVFWGEIPGFRSRTLLGGQIRKFLQRPLARASGIAAVGSRAAAAYQQLMDSFGRTSNLIHNIPYFCCLKEFAASAPRFRQVQDSPIRFLYCGQLIERKGVDLLLEAFSRLIHEGANATLAIVGEGPLRASIDKGLPVALRTKVKLLGFRPISELPKVFADADVFVLPSRHDGWGVVVNQAIGAGLPVIATTSVGAAYDLIIDGKNGFRVSASSAIAIYESMAYYCKHPENIELASIESKRIARSITMEAAVNRWHSFVDEALSASRS